MLRPLQKLKPTLRALQHKNYRLYFAGQGISIIGTWMQRTAMGWLVYRLSRSPLALGTVEFAGQLPTFVLALISGILIDRWNRLRLLIVTQYLAMLQAFLLTILVLTGTVAIWHLVLMAVFLGTVNAFDLPARQAFIADLTEKKEDLGNAIALNSTIINSARIIGPSLAGTIIATMGEWPCFLLNSISYLAAILALRSIRIAPAAAPSRSTHFIAELKQGARHALGFAPIRLILMQVAVVSLAGAPYLVLMPVFTEEVLHGTSETFGALMGTSGAGALIGALYLASRKSVLGLGTVLVFSTGAFGIGLIGFALSRSVWLSFPFVLIAGFGMLVQLASSNTLLQTLSDEDKRGRIMSFYVMAFMGTAPLGSLLSGAVAGRIGVTPTLLVGGGFCLVGAFLFARKLSMMREMVRPIFIRRGILPEMSIGLQTATELEVPPEE